MFLALFVRVYNLELMGWVPDTYDRLADAAGIAAGDFPQSQLYLPGIAIILAPIAALFPASLWAMQATVVAFGIALVLIGYIAAFNLTGQRRPAVMFGFTIALLPAFVHFSRDGVYDMINTVLIVLAILLVPYVRGRGLVPCILYGILVALTVNVRPTNVFLVPVLGIYWLMLHTNRRSPHDGMTSIISRQVLVVGTVLVSLCLLSAILGRWTNNTSSVPLSLAALASNLSKYVALIAYGPVGGWFVVPLALAGSVRLSGINKPLLVTIVSFLIVWPLVHAPLSFSAVRYMLPPQFFVFFLAVLGTEQLLSLADNRSGFMRQSVLWYRAVTIGVLCTQFIVGTGLVIDRWHTRAAQSDEGLFRELRPEVSNLEKDAVIISAVSRGFRHTEDSHRFLDLVDFWLDNGKPPQGLTEFKAQVLSQLSDGKAAYYLYSRFEEGSDFQGRGLDRYAMYFEMLDRNFRLTEVFRTTEKNFGDREWILYRIQLPDNHQTSP